MERQETRKWYVIKTGFRKEKYVQRTLVGKGVEAYVPLISKTCHYSRKTKTHHIPLISCYVFVRINNESYIEVLETPYVIGFIKFADQVSPIPNEEMELMKRIVGEHEVSGIQPISKYEFGERVELIAGGLTGIQGTVLTLSGKHTCLVELETLGYAIQIEVGLNQLRRVA